MEAVWSVGDRVRVRTRVATEADAKSNLYFAHFGGMVGSVQKMYDSGEVSVNIDHASLTKEIRRRHEDVRLQMKTKWMDGLSEEGRSKLTEREKDFVLRFVIITNPDDLEPGPPALEPVPGDAVSSEADGQSVVEDAITTERITIEELAAAEEAYFLARTATAE